MKQYTLSINFLLSGLLLIFWFACTDPVQPPPSQNTTIALELIETGIVDATLQVSIEDTLAENWTYSLTKNGSLVLKDTIDNAHATTVVDTNLTPATEYNYQAFWLNNSVRIDSSEVITVFTGDTTSHNFVWEIDTLGGYGSYLNDVHIVNEDDIWVVGNIETDSMEYNAAHWDGSEWEYIKILNGISSVSTINYFTEDNIWCSIGSFPVHWNGDEWILYHLQDMGLDAHIINAIWASSPDNIYFVGNYGSIVHYNGVDFIEIESGTDLDLSYIHGSANGEYIFITGYNMLGDSIILRIYNDEVLTFYENIYESQNTYYSVKAVVVQNDTVYFSTGRGLWRYNYLTQESILTNGDGLIHPNFPIFGDYYIQFTNIFIFGMNNIFFPGFAYTYNHFNGLTFKYGLELSNLLNPGAPAFGSDYEDELIIMVGASSAFSGLVIKGYQVNE
jgi:hypothetical protein